MFQRKAIAKVIASGGIAKEDPNDVRKKISPEQIKKQLKKNTGLYLAIHTCPVDLHYFNGHLKFIFTV